ncbi:MAG TPA: M23 family metallopeptidase [Solirubrobacterales bacterium]
MTRPALLALLLAVLAVPAAAIGAGDDGGLLYRDHVFPVQGPHGTRGSIGEFGAPRSGGRVHEGFDVVAACGTPLLAVRGGRVLRAGYDPVLYGNHLTIHGEGEMRSYFYAHLPRPSPLNRGDRVYTGQRVGSVGKTGNARTVGCHLHFEIHVGGQPMDPEPSLGRWDRYS